MIRPGVRRLDVSENGLVGAVFLPDGAADVPGVLVLGGSDGGMWEQSAAFLASEGYAALALAYFGMDGLPETLASIPLEYFETGIVHLQALPEVDSDQIGVLGVSRGGELALLLGATYPQIKGVIAYVPSGLVWFGLTGAGPAWTLGGAPVPYVTATPDPELQRQFQEAMMAGGPASWTPLARSMMEKELQGGSEAVIAVERINGPVLMFSGTDDGVWPSGPLAEVAIHRLEQHAFRFPYDHVSYRGAGHVFPPPYLPARYAQAPNGFLLGGSPEGTAHAQEDCWKRTLEFLGKTLKSNPLDRP